MVDFMKLFQRRSGGDGDRPQRKPLSRKHVLERMANCGKVDFEIGIGNALGMIEGAAAYEAMVVPSQI